MMARRLGNKSLRHAIAPTLRRSRYGKVFLAGLGLSVVGKRRMSTFCASRPMEASPLQQEKPLFRFGVIADIQHADIKDGTNFSGSERRWYRAALDQIARAANLWNGLRDPAPLFVAQLGDLIDGQNAGKYGEGLKFDVPQSEAAISRVIQKLDAVEVPMYHAIGNHELYNFDWAGLRERLNRPEKGWKVADDLPDGRDHNSPEGFNFSFRPVTGWTFIMLNPYEVSLIQDPSLPGQKRAQQLMLEHNPNDILGGSSRDFTAGLNGRCKKYVPYNGALGHDQLQWLRKEVVSAREQGDRIIVFSHLPVDARAATLGTVMYDCDDCVKILHEDGKGRVVAFFAGHRHAGGYVKDTDGLHHVTLESPLTHQNAFGYVEVYSDRLELVGVGDLTSRTLDFPTLHVVPSTATPSAKL